MDDYFTDGRNADIAFNKFHHNPLYIGFDDESYIPGAPQEKNNDDNSHIANSGDVISDSTLPLWAKAIRVVILGLIGLCLVNSILMVIFPETQTPTTYAAAEKAKSNEKRKPRWINFGKTMLRVGQQAKLKQKLPVKKFWLSNES